MTTTQNFTVPDMDCQACVRAITEAVHRLDAAATVSADLTAKQVAIGSGHPAQELAAAIEGAGFTVQG